MATLQRVLPPLPQTERGSFCQVSADSTGERLLYCNGSNVLWRSIEPLLTGQATEKPADVFCWKGHQKRVTAAAMAPNREWVVSGDITGAVRVWGAKGDNVQKNEYKLWGGMVKDVSWSGDSTRIMAAGDGKEVRACALIWDTGSKTGEVGGHTKAVNSISFRSQRPFRIVTGSEDMQVNFYQGPPFKFNKSHSNHTNFVNCVRYSPDGNFVFSAGSDSKICLYEGKDGDFVKEFAKPDGITGSIWQAAWSPSGARVVTAGGDKKVRVWDREAGAQVAEKLVGEGKLEDMQIGVAWPTENRIISVCLDGRLLFWAVGTDGALSLEATVDGTQGPLTCLEHDAATGTLLQAGADGFLVMTPTEGSVKKVKVGTGISHILTHAPDIDAPKEAWVFSLDECARRVSMETGEVVGDKLETKELAFGAGWLDATETKILLVSSKRNFHCLSEAGVEWSQSGLLPRDPTAFASLPSQGLVAVAVDRPSETVGGVLSQEFNIHMFASGADGKLSQRHLLEGHTDEVSAMKFAPSGEFLASATAGHKILVWSLAGEAPKIVISEWSFHTARITCLDWLPGSRRLVSGGLDRHLFVWDVDAPKTKLMVSQDAHKGGVSSVTVCGERSFASAGHDGFVNIWEIPAGAGGSGGYPK